MDQPTIAFVVAGALTAGCVVLVVYAFRRSIEALGVPAQIEGLARTLGGTTLGPLQWAAPWGAWQAGLLVETRRTGTHRLSIWLSRQPAAPPRLMLGVVVEPDEPLRTAWRNGTVSRVVLTLRGGKGASELRVADASREEAARAYLAQPELHATLRGALELGFDQLILYPTAGAELVLRKPRRLDLDPAFIQTALAWLQPIAGAIGTGS
jgi:hypothetical protein